MWLDSRSGISSLHCWVVEISRRHTRLGRTPLDEWSAWRRDLYLTKHNTHNRQTSMPPAGFEPAIPASGGQQTYALDRVATGIRRNFISVFRFIATFNVPPQISVNKHWRYIGSWLCDKQEWTIKLDMIQCFSRMRYINKEHPHTPQIFATCYGKVLRITSNEKSTASWQQHISVKWHRANIGNTTPPISHLLLLFLWFAFHHYFLSENILCTATAIVCTMMFTWGCLTPKRVVYLWYEILTM